MKRSEINSIMRDALAFLRTMNFRLPPFAMWSPKDWKRKGAKCRKIMEQQLGWDITDFGSGDFEKIGLFLFTVRNGTLEEAEKRNGKPYAEKVMIVKENQVTPCHFHFRKMEDIINRGGGELVVQLWNSTKNDGLAASDVTVYTDSVEVTVPAGKTIRLRPGESVCLPQRLYHKFWGARGRGTVLIGEVSTVNDDRVDNRFFEPVGRFPEIVEDEPPLHLLCGDYGKYCIGSITARR